MKLTPIFAVILAGTVALSAPAYAQFSKSYEFLDAVKEADGQKVSDALAADPAGTIVNAHDGTTGETALQIVTAKRDLTWMKFFIAKGAEVNAHDNHNQTPLVIAAGLGFTEGAQLLIDNGAHVDQPNSTGETPLIAAVHRHDLPMIRMLLAGGADPARTDNSGRSAQDYAALFGKENSVSAVLDNAAKTAHAAKTGSYGPGL